jgi:hypothetical protein
MSEVLPILFAVGCFLTAFWILPRNNTWFSANKMIPSAKKLEVEI